MGPGLIELLFAIIVGAGIIAIVFDPETGGMIVMTLALVGALWYLAGIVGPSIGFGVYVLFVAAFFAILRAVLGGGSSPLGGLSPRALVMLDTVLDQLRGAPPPERGRDRGGGGGQDGGGGDRRMPPRRRDEPEVFEDQDDD